MLETAEWTTNDYENARTLARQEAPSVHAVLVRRVLPGTIKIAFPVAFFAVIIAFAIGPFEDQIASIATCLLLLGSQLAYSRNKLSFALWLLPMGLIGIGAFTATTQLGIHDLSMTFFPIAMVFALLLPQDRWFLGALFAAIAVPFAIGVVHHLGMLGEDLYPPGWVGVILQLLMFTGCGGLLWLLRRALFSLFVASVRAQTSYREVLEATREGFIICDSDGRVVDLNDAAAELIGRSRNEIIDERLQPWLGLREEERLIDKSPSIRELQLSRRDGAERWCEMLARSATIAGIDRTLVILRDITQQRAVRERASRAEKFQALGQLAGGIAHDFNNQLTTITMYAGLLAKLDNPRAKAISENIRETAKHASSLTRKLLHFAQRGKKIDSLIDLSQLLRSVVETLERTPQRGLQIRLHNQVGEALTVRGDPDLLSNALLSLCVNAREAMPEGGTLELSLDVATVDGEDALEFALAAGRYLRVTVSDTGTGIPAEIHNRIYEPFFTTKEGGGGLSLAAVLGTIQLHEGAMRLTSEPGAGATFEILLPIAEQEALPTIDKNATTPVGELRGLSALIIDDQQPVAQSIQQLLEAEGVSVAVRHDGAAGIDFFREHEGAIDVVLVDVDLPGLRGPEVVNELRKLKPDVAAVLISGFDEGGDAALKGIPFLGKPFAPAELVTIVLDAIRRAR